MIHSHLHACYNNPYEFYDQRNAVLTQFVTYFCSVNMLYECIPMINLIDGTSTLANQAVVRDLVMKRTRVRIPSNPLSA